MMTITHGLKHAMQASLRGGREVYRMLPSVCNMAIMIMNSQQFW